MTVYKQNRSSLLLFHLITWLPNKLFKRRKISSKHLVEKKFKN